MSVDSYPYPLYAAVHGGNPGDVAFYRRACRGATRILELGCAGGRVSGTLVCPGRQVCGVDIDHAAVAACAAQGVEAWAADMREFESALRFDRIIAPYNTFYCLLDEADLIGVFSRVRRHLAPGGMLVFDGYAGDAFHDGAGGAAVQRQPATHVSAVNVEGVDWDVYESSDWWPATQRVDAHYRHVPRAGGAMVAATIRQRYLLSAQIADLLAAAGLMLAALHGDFDETPFDPDSPTFVVRAIRGR